MTQNQRSTHTPGPWAVIEDEKGYSYLWREGFSIDSEAGAGYVLGPFEGYSGADARLIAASPEMLEALELLWNYASERVRWFQAGADAQQIGRVVQAALAKARGDGVNA